MALVISDLLKPLYKHLPLHTRASHIYLSMTPTVEYDSREQLVRAIYRGRKEYGAMLGRVVDERLALNESVINEASPEQLGAERGTEVRTMVSSISCAEMRGEGVEILLRVTQGRGKWWAVAVNEAVIDAVERSFTQRVQNGLLWLVTFAGGRIDFGKTKRNFYISVRDDMVVEALDGILGCPYSGRFGAMHKKSYTYYIEPILNRGDPAFYILRSRLMDYLVAVLSMTHKRLGAASPGFELEGDMMFEIFKYIQFR
jgi:hypothetical protein